MPFHYDSRSSRLPYSPRLPWAEHYPADQAYPRSPQQRLHSPNDDGAGQTPLDAINGVYHHPFRSQQSYSLPLPPSEQDYQFQGDGSLQEYRPQSQRTCQSLDESLLVEQTFGTHLSSETAVAYPATMGGGHQHTSQDGEHANYPTGAHGGFDNTASWPLHQQTQASVPYPLNTTTSAQFPMADFNLAYATSSPEFMSAAEAQYTNTFPTSYVSMPSAFENLPFEWQGLSSDMSVFSTAATAGHGLPEIQHTSALPNSPTDSSLEVRSLSSSDNGWAMIEHAQDTHLSIFNPGETLHPRSLSESSYSDLEPRQSRLSWGSYVDLLQHPVGSPNSDSTGETCLSNALSSPHNRSPRVKEESNHSSPELSRTSVHPIHVKQSISPQPSPIPGSLGSEVRAVRGSPPSRRNTRKTTARPTKQTAKKPSPTIKPEEKKVGRRKGPLRPEQRKQACQIRKLGACLRCKFLKKTVSVLSAGWE